MTNAWKLGRLFGIDIQLHWSFLLVPLMVLFNNVQLGTDALAHMLTLVAAMFGCVVLHELGHALAARRYGIPTRDITLYPIGGIARLERMPDHPWQEFWIAVAGPAVNVAIVMILLPLLMLGGASGLTQTSLGFLGGNLLFDLAMVNVILVVFNMLPAFPSDGGRVLRALLAMRMNRLRATEIASYVGIGMAVLIAGFGFFYLEQFMPVVVAAFLVFAGQQELAWERYRARARHAEPMTVLPAGEIVEQGFGSRPTQPGMEGYSGVLWDHTLRAWVLWRNGRPVTVLG